MVLFAEVVTHIDRHVRAAGIEDLGKVLGGKLARR